MEFEENKMTPLKFSSFLQPKIQVASKYERRVDTRSYDDKKKLFEGVSIIFLMTNFNGIKYMTGLISKVTAINFYFIYYTIIVIDLITNH